MESAASVTASATPQRSSYSHKPCRKPPAQPSAPHTGKVDAAPRENRTKPQILQPSAMDDHVVDIDQRDEIARIEIHFPGLLIKRVSHSDVRGGSTFGDDGIGFRKSASIEVQRRIF